MIDFLLKEEFTNANVKIEVSAKDLHSFATSLIKEAILEGKKQKEEVPEEYLTRDEASKILKVSLPTLWHWNNKGILKPYRIGNKIRYKKSEIDSCLISINKD
ncbi:helix-turn-helix domain-containing protein [Carboxylicivirga sp. A043]|uniref:helix-turn-helix domain-containing protein n=1 Tax=Carboxylicivirga litoralis TaxID=2816963 RepID=UPI0021CB5C6D|nr:helix-turn-helix domain-containing protein [Carboxylicivirga sp. A043]MCU4158382.1 helix-turn-helix domain-containing protein [Carboxylicivirga sp. A043]